MKTILVFTIIGLILFWGARKVFSIEGYGVGPLEITEQDKSPDGYPSVLVVPNGALAYDATNTTATLVVATPEQVNSTYTALSLSTTTLGLTASNTNYVNLSGSTQTKTGGLNVMSRLGVGNSSPERLLDVFSGAGDVFRLGVWSNLSGDTSGGAVVGNNFYRIYNGTSNVFRYTNTHGTLGYSGTLYDLGAMYFYNALGATTKDADFTPRLRAMIDTSGNFGIGANSPQQLFHVFNSSFVVTNAGNVGIGTTNPESILHIAGSIPVAILQGSNEFLGPQFRFRDSAGSIASPSIPTQPDFYAGALYWDAYNGSAWKGVGAFLVNGDGTPSATSLPTSFNFLTTSPNQVDASVKAQLNSTGDMFVNSINASDTNRLGVGTFSMASGAQFEVTKSSFVVLTSGNVGIGTNAPSQKLHIADQTTSGAQALLQSFRSSSGSNSQISFNKARGTIASPATVTNGDSLGQYAFSGYDGTSYVPAAAIISSVDGIVGTNDMPGNLSFRTTPDGGSATLQRMIINNAGNVGIGTSDPTQKLHVSGNIILTDGTGNAFGFRGSTAIYSIQYVNDGSRYPIRFVGDNDSGTPRWFEFGNYTSNLSSSTWNPKVSINSSSGNVGIGSTAPTAKLDVNGSVKIIQPYSSSNPILNLTSSDAGPPYQYTAIKMSLGSYSHYIKQDLNDFIFQAYGDFGTYGSYKFAIGQSTPVVISYTGNVGIGTTNPGSKLQVTADANIGSNWKNAQLRIGGATNSNYQLNLGYDTTNNLGVIQSGEDGTAYKNLALNPNGGNVGIGTASPVDKLHVNGAVGVGGANPAVLSTNGSDLFINGGVANTSIYIRPDGAGSGNTGSVNGEWIYTRDYAAVYRNSGSLEYLRFDHVNGNVGIGTNSPNRKLTVSGGASLNDQLLYLKQANEYGYSFNIDSLSTGRMFLLGVNNGVETSPIMTFDRSNTYVGVGTTNPGSKLQVTADANIGSNWKNAQLRIGGATNSNYQLNLGYDTTNNLGVIQSGEDGTAYKNLALNPNGGNVGIGTTSPNDKLDMYSGAIRFYSGSDYQRLFANTWGLNVFTSKLTSSGLRVGEINGSLGLYSGDGATSYNLALTAPSGNAVIIAPNNTTAIYAASSGNVGIGTSNPAYRLELALDSAGKPTTNTWTITSDSRTKEDISEYTAGLNEIKQIRPITFTHNGLGGTKKGDQGVGVLAQEIKTILPNTVSEREKIFESTDDVKGFDYSTVVVSSAVFEKQWTVFNAPEGLMTGTTFFQRGGNGNAVVFKDKDFYYLFPAGKTGRYLEVKNTSNGFVYETESGPTFSAQSATVEVKPEKRGYKTNVLSFNSHEITFALVNAVKELSATVEDLKRRIEVLEAK